MAAVMIASMSLPHGLKNISVTNISGYCAEDLADYVVAAMYFVNKGLAFTAVRL